MSDENKEKWRVVEGFSMYRVSDHGNIFSATSNRCLKPHRVSDGYLAITLRDSKKEATIFLIHRLVAMAFVPNPDGKPQVNHIDGVKSNNTVSNLEWCTRSENIRHGWRIGLFTPRPGEKNPLAKLTRGIVDDIRCRFANNETQTSIARSYRIHQTTVSYIVRNKTWIA